MSDPRGGGALNVAWARSLLSALSSLGVVEVQVAPGSRSTPLVLAAAGVPDLKLRVHLDERSAAFFALGVGRRSRIPSAVITTSGTAVANLLPAVVEASMSDVPLLLLTADRPPSLRGRDANQTIVQPGIFGSFPRAAVDAPLPRAELLEDGVPGALARSAVAAALGHPPGPVHLNLPFDKPLHPDPPYVPAVSERADAARGLPDPDDSGERAAAEEAARLIGRCLEAARRPILLAGPAADPDRDGPAILEFGRRLGIPVLADPLSGARFHESGPDGVIGSAAFLLGVDGVVTRLRPDLILRTGRSPTASTVERALADWAAAVQVVLDDGSLEKDHQGLADHYLRASPSRVLPEVEGRAGDAAWRRVWARHEDVAWGAIQEGARLPGNEGGAVAAALSAAPSGSTFFVSNSMPVRDLDGYGRPGLARVRVLGNRGASGIDGIVSTVLGVAVAGPEPVVAVLGDLAFLHDLNGLLAARSEDVDAVLVVVDNDGGGIFHMLPIRAFEPAFTPYFATPHGLELRHGARLFGVDFIDVSSPDEVAAAVAEGVAAGGVRVVRIRTDRETNRRRHEETAALVEARVNEISIEGSHDPA